MMKMLEKTLDRKQEGELDNSNIFKFQYEMAKEYLGKKIFRGRDDRMKFALGIIRTETITDFGRIFGAKVSTSKASQILSEMSAKFLESFRKLM